VAEAKPLCTEKCLNEYCLERCAFAERQYVEILSISNSLNSTIKNKCCLPLLLTVHTAFITIHSGKHSIFTRFWRLHASLLHDSSLFFLKQFIRRLQQFIQSSLQPVTVDENAND